VTTRTYRTRPPVSETDLWMDGPPVKLRDLVAITGWTRKTLLSDIDSGRLVGFRRAERPGSPWFFHRSHAREYLTDVWHRHSA
jgi:hypothetical protein